MIIFKKLIFILPFLLTFAIFVSSLNPFLQNTNLIFSLSWETFIQLLILAISLSLTGLFFAIFATLASDWKYVLPISLIASLAPLLLISPSEALILVGGFFLSFILTFFSLQRELASYLSFNAPKLLLPAVGQIIFLSVLVISAAFYMASSTEISANGFKLPDSLIEASLKLSGVDNASQQVESSVPTGLSQASLTSEMIALAKQNPDILKQYGIDPKMLDTLGNQNQKNQTTSSSLKSLVEQKVQDIIKPFLSFVPLILSILFFFSITTLTSLLSLLNKLLTWFMFYILEKSGFVTFEKEMREVKKLVV